MNRRGFIGKTAILSAAKILTPLAAWGLQADGINRERGGNLTTQPVSFDGKCFFVNTHCPHGEQKIEILDETNSVISSFSADECIPVSADSTQYKIYKHEGLTSSISHAVFLNYCNIKQM